jgi:hypothetical protein
MWYIDVVNMDRIKPRLVVRIPVIRTTRHPNRFIRRLLTGPKNMDRKK